MREIPLSRGLVAVVDDEDFALATAHGPWSAFPSGRNWYARHTIRRPDGGQTSLYLHRVILDAPRVDHINGDGLDNRRANLRPATHADNMRNAQRRVDNVSGYKGVGWSKQSRKWIAGIHYEGKRIYLGLFADPTDAARAYDAAAEDLFGPFARLNFPEGIAS